MNISTERDLRYENDLFDKAFEKLIKGVPDHEFRHYNNSMGTMIYSKEHYKSEMRKRGMVPYDLAEELAAEWDSNHVEQSYDSLSPRALSIIKSVKMTADKNGNIKLGGRAIEALIEIGALKPRNPHMPKDFEGGFNA